MALSWQNDRQGSMYTHKTLEANWYEEQFQDSSGTNVGLRIPGRKHHDVGMISAADGRVAVGVARESEPALSSMPPENGPSAAAGLGVLPCLRRAPQPSTERTMHQPEWDGNYATTSKEELGTAILAAQAPATASSVGASKMAKTSMLSDATFMHTMTARESSLPSKGFGAAVPRHDGSQEARYWETTNGQVGKHALNGQTSAAVAAAEGDGQHDVLGRGGYEKARSNRLAVFPRQAESTVPAPLRTNDFRRFPEPTQGHASLCPPFAPERIARKTAFPEPRDAYLRPGVQIWSQ